MTTKFTMLLAFTMLAAFSVNAQMQRMTVEERVKSTMEKLATLKLNDDQQKKTAEAFTNYYTSQQKIMQDARDKGERPDMSVFQKLTTDRDTALQAIFTEQQYKKFKDEIEPALRPQRRGNQ